MIFPELAGRIKQAFSGLGGGVEPLSLKGMNWSFDPVTAKDMRMFPQVYSLLGGGSPSWSGENVSRLTALNHGVVWACNRIISESVGFLPLNVMRERNGEKGPAKDLPIYNALHYAPSADMTTMTFRETLTGHLVMGGNCYAHIIRRTGGDRTALELRPLLPEQVGTDRDKAGRLNYIVKVGNSEGKTYAVESGKPQEILHIPGLGYDGITGYSVLQMARQAIGAALSEEKYAAQFFGSGGRVPYHLEWDRQFKTDQEKEQFRADWDRVYSNSDHFHVAPILLPNMKYVPSGMKPEDMQLIESRLATPAAICRWFLISPHLVGDLAHASFSNIEHLALQFVKMTLTAWLTRWEQNLWRCVLTPEEQAGGYFFRHNVNGLLRGDFLTRMQGYATALQNGWLNQNEVRDLEDLNGFEGGEFYHIQLNQQTLPGGAPTASQQKLGSSKKGAWQ